MFEPSKGEMMFFGILIGVASCFLLAVVFVAGGAVIETKVERSEVIGVSGNQYRCERLHLKGE